MTVVYAAGTVCWRFLDQRVHVLVIRRNRYNDTSLPKGKLDPGETLPETAVRETEEETGLKVVLGLPLGRTQYVMPDGRNKEVHYWAAEVAADSDLPSFEPNDEVVDIEWVPLNDARASLSYEHDGDVLDRFAELLGQGVTSTMALLAVRHARPVESEAWNGSDMDRPLDQTGGRQADVLVRRLEPWGPQKLICSTAVRCRQTVKPFSERAKLQATFSNDVSLEALESGEANLERVAKTVLESQVTTVVCSHAPVIYHLVRTIAHSSPGARTELSVSEVSLTPASFWVVHFSATDPQQGILAIESHQAPMVEQ